MPFDRRGVPFVLLTMARKSYIAHLFERTRTRRGRKAKPRRPSPCQKPQNAVRREARGPVGLRPRWGSRGRVVASVGVWRSRGACRVQGAGCRVPFGVRPWAVGFPWLRGGRCRSGPSGAAEAPRERVFNRPRFDSLDLPPHHHACPKGLRQRLSKACQQAGAGSLL